MSKQKSTLQVVDDIAVSRKLRECFVDGGPEQKEIADRCAIPESTLSQWLGGKIPKGVTQITAVGCELGLTPDELYLADLPDRIRIKASSDMDALEAEQLDGLCQAGVALAEFTGPEGLRILKEHCEQLARDFKNLTKIPPFTQVKQADPTTKTYEPTDPKVVVRKMKKYGPKTEGGSSVMAGEAPARYSKSKRDRAVKALIDRVERSDGDVDTPAVGAPLIESGVGSPATPGTVQPEPAPKPGSSASDHKPSATPKNKKRNRNKGKN